MKKRSWRALPLSDVGYEVRFFGIAAIDEERILLSGGARKGPVNDYSIRTYIFNRTDEVWTRVDDLSESKYLTSASTYKQFFQQGTHLAALKYQDKTGFCVQATCSQERQATCTYSTQ